MASVSRQLDLFAPPPKRTQRIRARRTDPQTSHAAAARAPMHEHHVRILDAMDMIGGPATAERIGAYCGMRKEQVGRRMVELLRDGAVVVDGEAKTTSGRSAQCYRRVS